MLLCYACSTFKGDECQKTFSRNVKKVSNSSDWTGGPTQRQSLNKISVSVMLDPLKKCLNFVFLLKTFNTVVLQESNFVLLTWTYLIHLSWSNELRHVIDVETIQLFVFNPFLLFVKELTHCECIISSSAVYFFLVTESFFLIQNCIHCCTWNSKLFSCVK